MGAIVEGCFSTLGRVRTVELLNGECHPGLCLKLIWGPRSDTTGKTDGQCPPGVNDEVIDSIVCIASAELGNHIDAIETHVWKYVNRGRVNGQLAIGNTYIPEPTVHSVNQ